MTATTFATAGWDLRHAFRLHRFELLGLVALMAIQHTRMEPYRTFLRILQEVGSTVELPDIANTPPFLLKRADAPKGDPVNA